MGYIPTYVSKVQSKFVESVSFDRVFSGVRVVGFVAIFLVNVSL